MSDETRRKISETKKKNNKILKEKVVSVDMNMEQGTIMEICDKYTPRSFDDLIGRKNLIMPIVNQVREDKSCPHLLLEGHRGTGKTSLAHIIRDELYGDDCRLLFFELNSSRDRGVDVVREKIETWLKMAMPGAKERGIKHKIILLEEADQLTPEALKALKHMIEFNASTSRFILTCNEVNKIFNKEPAVISRCQLYHFDPIPAEAIEQHLINICKNECGEYFNQIDLTQINLISRLCKGDVRQSLKMLQKYLNGGTFTDLVDDIFRMEPAEFLKYSYAPDSSLIFQKMHEELLKYARTGKYDLSQAFISLAEKEYMAAISTLKVLQVQAAYFEIKKVFAAIKAQQVRA